MSGIFEGRLRVLDLAMGWAGPLSGQLLAEMGAQVIKVEDTRHFDWWRGSLSMGPPEARPIERSAVFNSANRGKLGVTLDLTDPRGLEIVRRLAAISDVLIENYSPGVMKRFGLDYDALKDLNPRLVMVSMPSFGAEGPEAHARGYGNSIEAVAGVTSLTRYHDREQPYTLSNALGDPVGGLHGAFAILVALRERERTGRGQWIELAQVEALIPFMAEPILEYQMTRQAPHPRGNRHPVHAPHGIYRCAATSAEPAEEAWVALGCESDEQWRALAAELGLRHLASDPRFAHAAGRKRNEDALDAELGRALAPLDPDEAVRRLKRAGVLAAPVNSPAAVLGDPQLSSRGFFVAIERAVVGTHLYPGAVQRLSAAPLDAGRPSPLLGEHNADVLRGILGMSEAEMAELERAGIIGTSPRQG